MQKAFYPSVDSLIVSSGFVSELLEEISAFFLTKVVQRLSVIMQTTTPTSAIISQTSNAPRQPNAVAIMGLRNIATVLPTYVQALVIPDIVETLPVYVNRVGR